MRRAVSPIGWIGAAAAAVVLAVPAGFSAPAATQTIGVVALSKRGTLPDISGLIPGRYAADSTAALLQRTVRAPVTVLPRKTMMEAEQALGWRDYDITKFARLTEHAQRAGAAHLVVGTLDRFGYERYAGSLYRSTATVSIQLFTPTPPKITKASTGAGTGLASVPANAAQQALRAAVDEAVKAGRAMLPHGP